MAQFPNTHLGVGLTLDHHLFVVPRELRVQLIEYDSIT